jgi:hypothetical protein
MPGAWGVRHALHATLELDMTRRWNPLVVGSCNVLGLALLALSATVGGSTVRAAGDSTLDSAVLVMKLADVLQQRMAKIEAAAVAVAQSLTTRRIATQELCVVDQRGAQTCITKVQLDALLKGAEQIEAAQTAAATPPALRPVPHTAETTEFRPSEPACRERCVAPEAPVAAAAPSIAPSAGAVTQLGPEE